MFRAACLLGAVALGVNAWVEDDGVCMEHFNREGFDDPMAKKYSLDDAVKDGAVCIDGTPAAYYYLPGTGDGATKWYIHHQGGGWCESPEDCYDRSKEGLGSSSSYPAQASLGGGYFSSSQSENPQMYNWNKVFMRYCDGGSFSGRNMSTLRVNDKDLHFRGHLILEAMQKSILALGLNKATDFIISGCSAGGLATYLHADEWAALVPHTKVKALPDSGFFLDVQLVAPQTSGRQLTTIPGNYHTGLVWVFNQMNTTSGLNQDCVRAHMATGDVYKCQFAEHTCPHLKTPTFPLQSEYDAWQTGHVLSPNPSNSLVQTMGNNITHRIQTLLLDSSPEHGVFLDSCHHHCGAWGEITIDGDVQAQAIQQWYESPTPKRAWIQGQPYPCEACCKNGGR